MTSQVTGTANPYDASQTLVDPPVIPLPCNINNPGLYTVSGKNGPLNKML